MSTKKSLFSFLRSGNNLPKNYTEQVENGVSTIKFHFDKPTPEGIDEINRFLLSRRFSQLSLEDVRSCLSTETRFNTATHEVDEIIYRCGINDLTLKGKCKPDEESFCYQFGTAAFSKGEMNSNSFNSLWRTVHPGYVIRVLTQVSYQDADAFIWLYHARS